ncbi:MAG: hypothetical protein RL077_787 [Verrucomicrobiota bacterium]
MEKLPETGGKLNRLYEHTAYSASITREVDRKGSKEATLHSPFRAPISRWGDSEGALKRGKCAKRRRMDGRHRPDTANHGGCAVSLDRDDIAEGSSRRRAAISRRGHCNQRTDPIGSPQKTFSYQPPHQNKFWPRREETAFQAHQRLAEAVSWERERVGGGGAKHAFVATIGDRSVAGPSDGRHSCRPCCLGASPPKQVLAPT